MHAWHCEVFVGDTDDSGNPALVLPHLPVVGRDDYPVVVGFNPADPTWVHFAAPKGSLPFCGHGSLAVTWVLTRELGVSSFELRTESQTVHARIENSTAEIELPPARSARQIELPPELAPALGVQKILRGFIGDAGSPKWIVETDAGAIENLRVDDTALAALSERLGVNGAYVVAKTEDGTYRARSFNPRTGHGEDRATGVAAVAFAACLGEGVVIRQGPPGHSMARLEARYDGGRLALLGVVRGRRGEVAL